MTAPAHVAQRPTSAFIGASWAALLVGAGRIICDQWKRPPLTDCTRSATTTEGSMLAVRKV